MKTWHKLLAVGLLVFLLFADLAVILIFDASWWFLITPLIIIFVIILVIGILFGVRYLRGRTAVEPEEKGVQQKISESLAMTLAINLLKTPAYAQELVNPQEKTTHEGGRGTVRTPIRHIIGDGFYPDEGVFNKYCVLIDLTGGVYNDEKWDLLPTKFDVIYGRDSAKFEERIELAATKLAPEPEIFETEEHVILSETGEPIRKTVRKKQTPMERKKEKEEEKEEEKEAL